MTFTQTITLQTDAAAPLSDLLETWHQDQGGAAPGYEGARLLADRDHPGRFVVEVDFTSRDEAEKNNTRPETQAWADKLRGVAQGEPAYANYEVAYRTS